MNNPEEWIFGDDDGGEPEEEDDEDDCTPQNLLRMPQENLPE